MSFECAPEWRERYFHYFSSQFLERIRGVLERRGTPIIRGRDDIHTSSKLVPVFHRTNNGTNWAWTITPPIHEDPCLIV